MMTLYVAENLKYIKNLNYKGSLTYTVSSYADSLYARSKISA